MNPGYIGGRHYSDLFTWTWENKKKTDTGTVCTYSGFKKITAMELNWNKITPVFLIFFIHTYLHFTIILYNI